MIVLNRPLVPDLKKVNVYLEKIHRNAWFTNFGPLQVELTSRLEDYLGVKNLLLVNNGTSALQVAARALNSKSYLSTPFSFAATVSALKWQNEKVEFCDINKDTYNLCAQKVLESFTKGCDADTIVATHVYGNPCDVIEFEKICSNENKKIIYDSAHAFGVNINNKSVLNYGDASTLSFHATKVFHTVEGGGIVFKHKENLEKAKQLINFGIKPDHGILNIGINAKLNEYQAAVGLVNLEHMDDVLEYRSSLFSLYREKLKNVVEIPYWHEDASLNGAYMPIKLQTKDKLQKLINRLSDNNIQSRHYFSPSLDQIYTDCISYGTENSHDVAEKILCLPMHYDLTKNDINKIVSIVKSI